MSAPLESLLQHPQIWRGRHPAHRDADTIASGFPELDAQLPGGGWPRGALTEIWLSRPGLGELQLLMPALARLSLENRWIALIAPPHIPYAPAWQTAGVDTARLLWITPSSTPARLWSIEQSLRTGACSAVLAWPDLEPGFEQLRRLQLAAEAGSSWGVLFRTLPGATQASPAAVRIQLTPSRHGLRVGLLKRRGAWGGESLHLPLSAAFP